MYDPFYKDSDRAEHELKAGLMFLKEGLSKLNNAMLLSEVEDCDGSFYANAQLINLDMVVIPALEEAMSEAIYA